MKSAATIEIIEAVKKVFPDLVVSDHGDYGYTIAICNRSTARALYIQRPSFEIDGAWHPALQARVQDIPLIIKHLEGE